ncbi:PIN domain-like protein [Podospora appendiculata]|uniref:PIN domain-like protein n=1 Tax=Podospora appendiculata TaxID=314037 RepID=A0AAE0X6P8_9PEZI|nr:PIN domain-like protein [Podospora appendiculata]
MPTLIEEPWISSQVVNHPLSELDDCSIAIDATYYLQNLLDAPPVIEPLIPALGVVAAIQGRLEGELELWKAHRVTPFFVFDGQSVIGQDEIAVERGRDGIKKTDYAWELYFNGEANEAVVAFGSNTGAFRAQELYPVLQALLKARGLHFLVAPFNAAAQVAYLDMADSDQCAGIMGSLELMLYPINDSVIRSIDWETKTVQAISKKHITRSLNVTESFFVDGLLMTGTSFLPAFPALLDPLLVKTQPYGITDALNMLRASEKSMALTCTTYHEVVKSRDPNWQDKYRKARMAVNHFVYIAESGEVKVHDADRLTKDNHEYLGLQLPSELFHYLNAGMIGPRVLSWITNGQLQVYPTVDGVASEEYKKLVSTQTVRIKEAALGLLIPRLNRGLGYKNITMKVWLPVGTSKSRLSSSTTLILCMALLGPRF